MKNKLEKQGKMKFTKVVIMPTASILADITIDGTPDNNMIKTTFIKKLENLSLGNKKPISSIKNFLTDGGFHQNDDLENEIDIVEDTFKIDNGTKNSEIEFLESINQKQINIKNNNENFKIGEKENIRENKNFFEIDKQNLHESTRSKKISDVKNEFKINELKGLMSNINHELTNRIVEKGRIIMNGHKFDENALYRQFETNYECGCHSCQKLNSFKKDNKNFKNIYGRIQDKEPIQQNNRFSFKQNESFDLIKPNSFPPGYHSEFEKKYEKLETKNYNETIYSQSILNNILKNKICQSLGEFLLVSNSLEKKKAFLNDLKNGKFGLNDLNKIEVGKMIEKLSISEKRFLDNNINYLNLK